MALLKIMLHQLMRTRNDSNAKFSFRSDKNTLYYISYRPVVPGCAGCAMAHPDLADQLTLFEPGVTDFAQLITTGTPGFSDLPTALLYRPLIMSQKVTSR